MISTVDVEMQELFKQREYEYRCNTCKKNFKETAVVWMTYAEYPGACPADEPVSPCCHSGYDDAEEVSRG